MFCAASSAAPFAMDYKLQARRSPFSTTKLVAALVREMGSYYAELVQGEARATQVLAQGGDPIRRDLGDRHGALGCRNDEA